MTDRYCRKKEQNIPLPVQNKNKCYVSVGIVVTTVFKFFMYRVHKHFLKTGSLDSSCRENGGSTKLSELIIIGNLRSYGILRSAEL